MANTHLYCTINEALAITKKKGVIVCKVTMINWVKKNQLGTQPGGKFSDWYICKKKLHSFLNKLKKGRKTNV